MFVGSDSVQNQELAEYAISVADRLGFEYSEAYLENSYGRAYAVQQGELNASVYIEKAGLRIRLIKDGKLYTFSTNKFDRNTISRAISRYKGFVGTSVHLSDEKPEKARYSVSEKKKIDSADALKDLLDLDKTLSENKYIKYRSLYASVERSRTLFINSQGARVESNTPSVGSVMSIIVKSRNETRQRILQFGGVGGYELLNMGQIEEQVLDEASALVNVINKGVSLSSYELSKIKNVVIAPEISGIAVHESVGHPNEADRVFLREAAQAGTSYLTKDNIGMRIGSYGVTIIDDPTIKNSNGFYLYDDEGVKARPKTIVDNGRQNELLTNREYAYTLGGKSNASARSDSYSNEPIVRMSNTYLKPGDASLDELVSEANDGVYIKSFMEWNIDDTRSFSRYQGSEAYLIRNHRLGKPVKNYKLETKTIDFWHAVKLLSKELELYVATCGKGEPEQGVPVTMGGPSALLSFG